MINKSKLPMQITLARMFLTIPIMICLLYGNWVWNLVGVALFMIASISDYYDGYFARKFSAVSNMGKFMDPVADKILVTSILIALIVPGKVDPILAILLISRDTLIGAIRSVAAADGVIIDAKPTGKWKTAMQMMAIPAVMMGKSLPFLPDQGVLVGQIGTFFLWISVVLSIWSGIQYYQIFLQAKKKA